MENKKSSDAHIGTTVNCLFLFVAFNDMQMSFLPCPTWRRVGKGLQWPSSKFWNFISVQCTDREKMNRSISWPPSRQKAYQQISLLHEVGRRSLYPMKLGEDVTETHLWDFSGLLQGFCITGHNCNDPRYLHLPVKRNTKNKSTAKIGLVFGGVYGASAQYRVYTNIHLNDFVQIKQNKSHTLLHMLTVGHF